MTLSVKGPQARTLVLLSGLSYVPAAILTPFVTNYQLKKSGVDDAQRKLLVRNETVRQIVSAGIHFITFYGGVLTAGKLFKNKAAQKPFAELLTGVLFSTVGHGIIRPILTNGILVQWLKKDEIETAQLQPPESTLKHSDFESLVKKAETRAVPAFASVAPAAVPNRTFSTVG